VRLNHPSPDHTRVAKGIAEVMLALREQWSQTFSSLNKYLADNAEQLARTAQAINKRLENLPDKVQAGSMALAARGWYIDYEFPVFDLGPIHEALISGQEAHVDKYMCSRYEEALPLVEARLLTTYPKRSTVLAEALQALREKRFSLAIPVLLAQADGICVDVFGGKLFQKKNQRPQVAEKIDALGLDDTSGMFLSVLKLPGGICASEDFRSLFPHCLNRHEILHGLDSDYGTELNGWKALSLVAFVGLFAPDLISSDEPEVG